MSPVKLPALSASPVADFHPRWYAAIMSNALSPIPMTHCGVGIDNDLFCDVNVEFDTVVDIAKVNYEKKIHSLQAMLVENYAYTYIMCSQQCFWRFL